MIVEMQSLDKNELTHIVGGAGPLKWAWKLCRKFFSKRTVEVTSSSGAKHTLESHPVRDVGLAIAAGSTAVAATNCSGR